MMSPVGKRRPRIIGSLLALRERRPNRFADRNKNRVWRTSLARGALSDSVYHRCEVPYQLNAVGRGRRPATWDR
jgi:hypothetical protein